MTDKENPSYIVVFDVTDPDLNIPDVRRVITTDPAFSNWWNYIPGTYIVSTQLEADDITEKLKPAAADARFLVIAVDPRRSEGWLPERAWRWIRRRSHRNHPSTTE